MRTLWLLSCLVASAPAGATSSSSVEAFEFLAPGKTTEEEATRRLGEPAVAYGAWVLEEQTGVFSYAMSPSKVLDLEERARSEGKRVERVRIAEWDVDNHRQRARLVFSGERLWYAVLPVSEDERAVEALKERYGMEPEVTTVEERIAHDVIIESRLLLFSEHGVAYRARHKSAASAIRALIV